MFFSMNESSYEGIRDVKARRLRGKGTSLCWAQRNAAALGASTTVAAPTYAANSSSHTSSRYLTFGLTWRIGKLDLEWQARGGAAEQ